MNRPVHLDDALVLDLVTQPEFELPAEASAHLESCPRCAADVRELREIVAHARDHGAEPPAAIVARVLALMPPAAPRAHRSRAYPFARLVFDSHAAQPELMALRAMTAVRQLAWHIEGLVIDAEIEHSLTGEGGHLVGQITPESPASERVESGDIWLEERGHDPVWAPLDPSGEFSLPAPRGRRWSLWIDWGRWRVRVRGT